MKDNLTPISKRFIAQLIHAGILLFTSLISDTIGSAMESRTVGTIIFVFGIIVFLAVNIFFLSRDGQSIGKKIMKIKIIDQEHQCVPAAMNLIFMRYVIPFALYLIPLSYLIDVAWGFFDENRKCIHDHLAKTLVVDCSRTGTQI